MNSGGGRDLSRPAKVELVGLMPSKNGLDGLGSTERTYFGKAFGGVTVTFGGGCRVAVDVGVGVLLF